MSTELSASYSLPCDVETAYAALSSQAWPERKNEMLHDGSRSGTWVADVPGAPVDVSGTMQLVRPPPAATT